MPAPAPDAAIAALWAEHPCIVRRWLGNTGNSALLANYNAFPWKGQNIDSPVGKAAPLWTSDDDTHPIP